MKASYNVEYNKIWRSNSLFFTQRGTRLPATVRRQLESSLYGTDCLHSETSKDMIDVGNAGKLH